MTFLLAVLGAVLLIALLSVFLLWRRETRRDGDRASWSGLALPLLVVVVGGLGYLTLGYHPETAQWLSDRRELSDAARRVIQGQPPEIDNDNLSAAAFARVLQSEVVREHQTMDGWYALGLLYDQLGAPAQAEEAARRALFLEPDNDAARLLLARSLIQANEGRLTDAAEAEIQKVLEAYPQHDGAWMLQAMAASRAHRYELALRSWQALLARHGEGEAGDLLRQGKANTERQLAKARQLDDLRITVNAGDVAAGGTLFVFLRQGEQGAAVGGPSCAGGAVPGHRGFASRGLAAVLSGGPFRFARRCPLYPGAGFQRRRGRAQGGAGTAARLALAGGVDTGAVAAQAFGRKRPVQRSPLYAADPHGKVPDL